LETKQNCPSLDLLSFHPLFLQAVCDFAMET